jgi:predicted nuclease of restriction endonuclease-like (RecB) superfamily
VKRKKLENKSLAKAENSLGYEEMLGEFVELLETSRRSAARAVNSVITATYWEIGRRIVEIEQGGETRAEYGEELLKRLANDLTARFGRGFSRQNLQQMRLFYLAYEEICQTLSSKFEFREIAKHFPLSWSHYVKLLAVKTDDSRKFYESEALRGGWSVRQLERQINTMFYERALLSKNKAGMLKKGEKAKAEDFLTPDEEIRDPLVLEFLNLKDEYSELELEEAIIKHLENFLLELGTDFAFVGRQKRLRIDDEWFRVDLVFYHRRLRCLILIDLKLGKLTHADIGQMHLYCNYAKANWTLEAENPPVGLILCSSKGESLAKYALDGLPNKIVAREYLMLLPDEKTLQAEIEKIKHQLNK